VGKRSRTCESAGLTGTHARSLAARRNQRPLRGNRFGQEPQVAGADTALVLADHRRMASCRATAPATSPRTFQLGRELLDAGARSPLGIYSAGVPIVNVSARRFAVVEDLNGSAPGSVLTCRRQLAARAGSGRQPAPAVGTASAVSAGAAGAAGRRILAASRSRSLITPST